ncbi:fatty acyl-AMP ligase [Microbacterium pygmaeum]|uniref:Acyl-CoA synthetase (AMP-forming)/AMP-acid ligase II n=1 Tax=Microbacterium pygmaeum TaxID=370764 RepID=A0A1G8E3D6_9MICO|nr:fatty acyl-AMP ligase [Microbacterium pygmaeum]SDH64159.1 Acyl-CoA synthetase (AMP-forming)/AMP-acid ligase II [Microbacterium pygmaeum]
MTHTRITLVDALRQNARELGNENGILYYDAPDSSQYRGFADLDLRARTIADSLAKRGYTPGQTVTIGLTSGLDWADAAWGVLYAGLALVPAPVAGYGTGAALGERVAAIARSAEASVFLTDKAVVARLGDAASDPALPALLLEDLIAEGDPETWTPPAIDGDSLAYLLFTSGSTGDPKGVIATHGTVLGTANAAAQLWGTDPTATLVGWSPMHHIMGLMLQVIIPGVSGAKAVVTSTEQFQRRPITWLQLISKHKGTSTAAGNFAFALVTQLVTDEQLAELDLSSLQVMFSGSEPVRPETVRAFLDRFAPAGVREDMIAPVMGMTEANLISGKFPGEAMVMRNFDAAGIEAGRLIPAEGEGSVSWVSCGRPQENTTVVIVDPDTFMPVPDGTVGEIWVASPMVSPGYFRRPDATAETFGRSLPGSDKSFMRTGDLAAFLDGELYVTGRLKEMIIVRGRNLYPQDLEAASRQVSPAVGISAAFELQGHPSVVGIVLEYNEEALAESGDTLDELAASVRETLIKRSSLPSLAVAFVKESTLPRTPTGKVRRTPTRTQIEQGELPAVLSVGFAALEAEAR